MKGNVAALNDPAGMPKLPGSVFEEWWNPWYVAASRIMPEATPIEKEAHAGTPRKMLDLKFGYALLTDRRVPLLPKIAAIGTGFAGVAILGFLELPVETIIAAVPVLGILGDLTVDGAEAIIAPVLAACLLLPYMAPAPIVERIRRERDAGVRTTDGPIIDV